MRINPLALSITALLLVGCTPVVYSPGPPLHPQAQKPKPKPPHSVRKHHRFTHHDRNSIARYYRDLPPGLQKKVYRGGKLPPGWQKKLSAGQPLPPKYGRFVRPLPHELERQLPPPPGTMLRHLEHQIILIDEHDSRVLDVIDIQGYDRTPATEKQRYLPEKDDRRVQRERHEQREQKQKHDQRAKPRKPATVPAARGFTPQERQNVVGYYRDMPPGMQKMRRGGKLPKGWQQHVVVGKPIPDAYIRRSAPLPTQMGRMVATPPEGMLLHLESQIILINRHTRIILDIINF